MQDATNNKEGNSMSMYSWMFAFRFFMGFGGFSNAYTTSIPCNNLEKASAQIILFRPLWFASLHQRGIESEC